MRIRMCSPSGKPMISSSGLPPSSSSIPLGSSVPSRSERTSPLKSTPSIEERLPLAAAHRRYELAQRFLPLLDDGQIGIAVDGLDQRLESGRFAHHPPLGIPGAVEILHHVDTPRLKVGEQLLE